MVVRDSHPHYLFRMNDLISTHSFKKYTDLKEQVYLDDDIESGKETINLEHFFNDIESVNKDINHVERIYKTLHEANEESKTLHNANNVKKLRIRMDSDVEHVLKLVKTIKVKIEELERSNADHRRNIPGCGPGSSADRTRTSLVNGLGKKLKDLMDDFQRLRSRMNQEYKETVERRYFTITGETPDQHTIETLISSGQSETILQKAIQQQTGRAQIMDTVSEIQERHDTVKEIERSLMDLHQIFLDMAALVEAQGHHLNDIESHVAHASSFVRRGVVDMEMAKDYQKSSRKWTCIAIIVGAIILCIILIPIVTSSIV